MFHLVDVSHHQRPDSLDWVKMRREGCDGMFARATYGTMMDRACAEHIARAREAGLVVGVYHFSRASQPVGEQIEAFTMAARMAGYGKPEDLIPALDVEDDTQARPLKPEQAGFFETMASLLEIHYRVKPYIYVTQRDWGNLGRPEWMQKLPLWVAHYAKAGVTEPATPGGRAWDIWQCTVAPFAIPCLNGYRDVHPQIDQNRARRLRFLDGRVEDGVAPVDEEISPRRVEPDRDGTEEKMALLLESVLRAEATEAAASSGAELLGEGHHGKDTLT